MFGSTLNRSGLEEHADTQFQDYVWAYGAKSYGKQAPIERKVSVVMRWVYAAENYLGRKKGLGRDALGIRC